jgi:ERCC4-type nuclease
MILVDDRVGSADIAGYLRTWRVPCELTRLEFGDAAFIGNGKNGPVAIGVEVKAVRDALACMTDGRFAGHQLPGLMRTYERIWLILEGYAYPRFSDGVLLSGKPGHRDAAELGARRFMYRDLDNWLTTMEICAGVRLRRTADRMETARVVADIHSWFSKPFDEHKAHLAFHEDGPDVALLTKPSLIRRVAAQLPGIGWGKSMAVAARFGTVESLLAATMEDLMSIPGIGEKLAWEIWHAFRR